MLWWECKSFGAYKYIDRTRAGEHLEIRTFRLFVVGGGCYLDPSGTIRLPLAFITPENSASCPTLCLHWVSSSSRFLPSRYVTCMHSSNNCARTFLELCVYLAPFSAVPGRCAAVGIYGDNDKPGMQGFLTGTNQEMNQAVHFGRRDEWILSPHLPFRLEHAEVGETCPRRWDPSVMRVRRRRSEMI
jgi:hypothetical protein